MLRLPSPQSRLPWARKPGLSGALAALLIAVVVGAAASLLQATGIGSSPLGALDDAAHDLLLRAQPADAILGSLGINPAADPRAFITIVAIDERTISELGAYNGGYPRSYHAQVVENLLAAPPRVIAFDFGFFEPTSDDAVLAAAFAHARALPVPTTIILGTVGVRPQQQANARTPSGELTFDSGLAPVSVLASNATLAFANIVSDTRGTIRSMPLVAFVQGVEQPTLGLAATSSYLRRHDAFDTHSGSSLEFAGRSIPLEGDDAVRINYFGPPSQPYAANATFRVISFVDVLRGRVDPAVWKGGLVLIGTLGAVGLADDFWTPMSDQGRKMAGVEIHANVAATLFSTRFLANAPLLLEILLILSVAVLMALSANLGTPAAWIAPCLVLAAYVLGDTWALYTRGLLLPFSMPILAGLVSLSGATAQRVASEQRLARNLRADVAHGVLHDLLTGLPNRAWIQLRLGEAIAVAQHLGQPCALLLVDLDRFKEVNESLGHQVGDAVLREVATRLVRVVPALATVARHGGDEFVVLLPGSAATVAQQVAARVIDALRAPVVLNASEARVVGASIGVVAFPEHGLEPDSLLRHAEMAMYAAKQTRGSVALYFVDQDRQSFERLTLGGSLGQALEEGQLVLYYQPKVECRSRRLVGVEALARWQHPQLGMVGPDRFIGLAEEIGLIAPLTRWALSAALRQARAWLDAGLELPIAVNLSAFDVQEASMPFVIAELLARWNVPARLLTIEITEGALLTQPALALDVLQRLERLGVGAALDDFGTGYSSLAYLKQFPVHELKIDRSLVSDIVREPRDRTIVRSTVELGHSLGLVVVAEGVEDAATLSLLGDLGCDLAQGFLIARPMSAAGLVDWVRDRPGQERQAAA